MSTEPIADEAIGCFWDMQNPNSCFDERSCGCFMDTCTYFGLDAAECIEAPPQTCCTLVDVC